MKKPERYYLFLLLILLLSIPFYIWGAFFPVSGLPFGLPISFLMIFVPFGLSLREAWISEKSSGIKHLFQNILDIKKARPWALIASVATLPGISVYAFLLQRQRMAGLPGEISIPFGELPLMLLLYFLGAIPEELAWTSTLTIPLTRKHGPLGAGIIIGFIWGVWHVIPWSWAHPTWWVIGMLLLNLFFRIIMVYTYVFGGESLFTGLLFHTMINVCTGLFPNSGSHFNPWVFCTGFLLLTSVLVVRFGAAKSGAKPKDI